jgi:threonine/homoserine efflux transporter RhtA
VGYLPAARATFGGAVAAVGGALTGLLFVALSVKGTALSRSVLSGAALLILDRRPATIRASREQLSTSSASRPT